MNDIDRKIQAALQRAENSGSLVGEPNLAEEVVAAFRGRYRWLSAAMAVLNFAFFAGAVWAGFRFYHANSVPHQLQWAAVGFLLLILTTTIKLWFWLEMHTNRVLREVKRVELLLLSRGAESRKSAPGG